MSLFREISAALREGLDELLSASPSRDEVDELTSLLEADLDEAKSELDQADQDFRRLSARIEAETQDAERLRERAKEAVDAGDDEQGRELIRRRRRVLRGIEILEGQAAEHTQLCAALQDHIEALEDKLQEIRLRRDFLRTRHRVQSLQERYERYQREYGLAELAPRAAADDTEVLFDDPPQGDEPVVPEGPLTPRRTGRLADGGESEPAGLRRRDGRAELPAAEEEPELRPRVDDADDEIWDRPSRNLRRERDSLLEEIERRNARPEVDAEVEAELDRLKRRSGRAVEAGEPGPPMSPPRPRPDDDLDAPSAPEVEAPDEPDAES